VTALGLTGAVVAATRRRFGSAGVLAATAAAADACGRVWSRRTPGPIPAALRWVLRVPHPAGPLRRALQPAPGERVLEVGPGLGQNAVQVAEWVTSNGRVDILDVQREMLDATLSRAGQRGVANITATLADENAVFPYGDATFDTAYLNSVLGEIPDPAFALSELHRVLRPGGRLVVGEVALDPDFVSWSRLQSLAAAAGFRLDKREGQRFVYFARYVK
jgi:SAM-dependent methyltransferase